jgi:hypothetical protein
MIVNNDRRLIIFSSMFQMMKRTRMKRTRMMVKTEVKENLLAPGSTIASSYKLGKDFSTLYCSVHASSSNGLSTCT